VPPVDTCETTDIPIGPADVGDAKVDYQTSKDIYTNGNVRLNTRTTYQAGRSIVLNPGFQVDAGIEFIADIEDCEGEEEEIGDGLAIQEEVIIEQKQLIKTTISSEDLLVKVVPNPFTSYTKIQYEVPKDTKLNMSLYDMQGKKIRVLQENSYHLKGSYEFHLDLSIYNSGMYFIHLQTPTISRVEKLILLD